MVLLLAHSTRATRYCPLPSPWRSSDATWATSIHLPIRNRPWASDHASDSFPPFIPLVEEGHNSPLRDSRPRLLGRSEEQPFVVENPG